MIVIEVNEEGVLSGLRRLAARLDDMRPMMAEIGEALREASMEAFSKERAPDGGRWAPLSPVTLRRRRGGPVHRILQDTGTLRQSITRQLEGGHSVLVGSAVEYAPYHQLGTRRIPARRFLGVSPEARSEIADALAHWLELDR